jgi:aspartokinase
LIVTDVDGVYSADPRRDPTATWLPALSHSALVNLTHSGAVVVHPGAARLAAEAGVPLRVLHHAAPLGRAVGTRITQDADGVR